MKLRILHSAVKYWILGISILALNITVLRAQIAESKRPGVGNHYFTPVTYSNLPFTNTYFYTTTGFGQTIDLVHSLNYLEELGFTGFEGEVTFIEMGFSYQQQVRDWLAAYMTYSISARLGTELQSILTQGINNINSFHLGWHIKLFESEKVAISTIAELQNHQSSYISVLGFIRDIINNHPRPQLVQDIPVLAFVSGFRFAYGLNDLIGIKFSTDLGYGETYVRGENGFVYKLGGGIDLDFYHRYSVPVGIVLNYSATSMSDVVYNKDETAQMLRLKIAYTKAADFSLGIETTYLKVPLIKQQKPVNSYSIGLAARYYF